MNLTRLIGSFNFKKFNKEVSGLVSSDDLFAAD